MSTYTLATPPELKLLTINISPQSLSNPQVTWETRLTVLESYIRGISLICLQSGQVYEANPRIVR
jgi:hypothetical protein